MVQKKILRKVFFFDENTQIFKLCYETCDDCYKYGNTTHHDCKSCANDFTFIEEEPNNCLPKCAHFYYYNEYKQYKCSEEDECPKNFPYLIVNKSRCIDNCQNDITHKVMYNYECLKNCPEGTSAIPKQI